jgi:plasmid maintenance system antidote protein VapI
MPLFVGHLSAKPDNTPQPYQAASPNLRLRRILRPDTVLCMTLQEWFDLSPETTKVAFAKLVGCSPQTITDLCKGRNRPSLSLALDIEKHTDGDVPPNVWIEPNGDLRRA